ncbi:MAG: hypothetical protein IPM29_29155 [Planctomycetes bacterium]|nr:hypothetical protein [Planctomycetota bacterium]
MMLVLLTARLAAQQDDDATRCVICHRAAREALEATDHAALWADPDRARAGCTVCHVDAELHASAARDPAARPVTPPAVESASCRRCHGAAASEPARARHPWRPRSERERREELPADAETRAATMPAPDPATIDWSGLVEAGYRFVEQSGSEGRFATDVNLDDGARLFDAEFEATGAMLGGALDHAELRAHDIDDPYSRIHARLGLDEVWSSSADLQQRRFRYRASGDFHRVDLSERIVALTGSVTLTESIRAFADFTRTRAESFWLTNRIGDRNTTPQTTVDGVVSPRRLDGDEFSVGMAATRGAVELEAAGGFRSERLLERWTFDRPSTVPGIRDAEDFRSRSTTSGPVGRLTLRYRGDDSDVVVRGRLLELQRTVDGDGTRSGVSTEPFATSTTSRTDADASTALLDVRARTELGSHITWSTDLGWRLHRETARFDLLDRTSFPDSGTVVETRDRRTLDLAQRRLDARTQLEIRPLESLSGTLGYGFQRDFLRVPRLDPGSPDFVEGTAYDHGLLAGIAWRPDEAWSLGAQYEGYARSGALLHELEEDDAQRVRVDVERRGEWSRVHAGYRGERASRRIADHDRQRDSVTLDGSLTPADGDLELLASWTFIRSESRTLTSFWFDPDPDPVPTIVGFTGDTHVGALGLDWRPRDDLGIRIDVAAASTRGSFDVDSFDVRAAIDWRLTEGGSAALTARQIAYHEAGGRDDYDATIIVLAWRQTFGRRRDD